jgi:probable F420-dependent oxidoreductase
MMATNARIGFIIPGSFSGKPPALSEFTEFFRRVDDLGFHALWVIDRLFHHISILEPLTLLTCAATVTSRIRLGTSVILFVLRNPVLMAKTTATLDYLSGGRLILGVSLGGRDQEFEALGVPIKQRVSRLQEQLTVMRKLWTEQQVTFHGRYYHLDNVNMEPKPLQKPGIPILMGGRADAVLQRSAEQADGWIAGGQGSPEAFHEAWQKVRGYAMAAGKDPDALDSGKLLYITVGADRKWCQEQLTAFTHAYYGPQYDVGNNCVFGSPTECAAKIQGFIDAGAKTIILGPTWPDVEQVTRIAREVVPQLQ